MATDEDKNLNETLHWANDEIGVAVQKVERPYKKKKMSFFSKKILK